MTLSSRLLRQDEIHRIHCDLERDSFPRLQMLLIVTLTGLSGFVASYVLLHTGLVEMWLRYLVSIGVAYLVFLALLWLWLRTKADDYSDVPDFTELSSPGSEGSSTCSSGQGGDFGGAGVSASFDAPSEPLSTIGESGGAIGDALGTVAEADEFAIPLAVILLIGAMALSSIFVIYSAPILFSELLVDGVLSASLYRRLRGLETQHWLETALKRTALPFALTAILVTASGWAMSIVAPQAHSLGEVISCTTQGE